MSVRKIPKNRITKNGRSYAFIVTEYGLDGIAQWVNNTCLIPLKSTFSRYIV